MNLQVIIFIFIGSAVLTAVYLGDQLPLLDAVLHPPGFPEKCPTPGVNADGCFYRPQFYNISGIDFAADIGHNTAEFFKTAVDLFIEGLVYIGHILAYAALVILFVAATAGYPGLILTTFAPWWVSMLVLGPLSIFFIIKVFQVIWPGSGDQS